jgi:hypothetical protein
MTDYTERAYEETFEAMYTDMMYKKKNHSISKDDLEALLQNLYFNEGNNWAGQSDIKQTRHAATIAACEAVLAEWD